MCKRLASVAVVAVVLVGVLGPAARAETVAERVARRQEAVRAKIDAQRAESRAPVARPAASRPNRPAAARASAPSGPSSPVSDGKAIEILLGAQVLRAWEGRRLVMETAVSTGAAGTETPRGSFRVLSKERNHWSTRFKVWMPWAMRVVGGIFIHELPLTSGGRRIGAGSLGSPVSHGCIRVGVGPAESLYHWAPVGTPVLIR